MRKFLVRWMPIMWVLLISIIRFTLDYLSIVPPTWFYVTILTVNGFLCLGWLILLHIEKNMKPTKNQ